MVVHDFKCKKCGHEEKDVFLNKYDDEVFCPMCENKMDVVFNTGLGFTIPPDGLVRHKRKYGNKLPDDYKISGGANFGKIR